MGNFYAFLADFLEKSRKNENLLQNLKIYHCIFNVLRLFEKKSENLFKNKLDVRERKV